MNVSVPLCARPGCKKAARSCGLCNACYQTARRLMIDKAVTLNQLIAAGKLVETPRLKNKREAADCTKWLMQARTI